MEAKLDNATIRNSTPPDLAKYLRSALERLDSNAISAHLLNAVASEYIPPTVFEIWLSVCHDPAPLVAALQQQDSIFVRKTAIKFLSKWLRSPRVSEVWSAVGGTRGLLDFLAQASVREVVQFCRAVGRTSTTMIARQERQALVTELVEGLACAYFPNAKQQSHDRRPLLRRYARMIPACTLEFVREWTSNESLPSCDIDKLMQPHTEFAQERCLDALKQARDIGRYNRLLMDLPPFTTHEKGVSESMAFAIRLLREMQTDDRLIIDSFWDRLAVPMIKRLCRRRCSTETRNETLQMILLCIKRHCDLPDQFAFEVNCYYIITYIARMWARHPEQLQDILVAYLTTIPARALTSPRVPEDLHRIAVILGVVRPDLRLRLLKLTLLHMKTFGVDLESDDDVRRWDIQLPVRLFRVLLQPDARELLERVLRLSPDISMYYGGGHSRKYLQWPSKGGLTSLSLYLSRDQEGIFERANAAIEECRKKATSSREQSDRADHAVEVISCAIASGSLELYRKTLLWARRFNRDALTVRQIYRGQIIQAPESLDLLCGIPERPRISVTTIEDVERDVKQANEICVLLLETACMIVSEPSFNVRDWGVVTSLFRQIFDLRLDRVNRLQDVLELSSERVYQAVWQHTQETCLTLERLGHKSGNEPLRFDRLSGPLQVYMGNETASIPLLRPATLRFLDGLAKQRDDLWRSFRKAANSDVVTLQEPWPQGLPIQQLLSVDVTLGGGGYVLPYICQRAESIVFMASSHALSTAEGIESAIGPFVEDWQFALQLYVNQSPQGPQRVDRAQKAWTYALDELSGSRMSRHEAVRLWSQKFSVLESEVTKKLDWQLPTRPAPSLPEVEDPSQATEWNPDPNPTQCDAKARRLDRTALDSMLVAQNGFRSSPGIEDEFQFCDPSTVLWKEPPFWDIQPDVMLRSRAREAQVAAALLYLNCKRCPAYRLLAAPFPAPSDVRFPALYLEDEFLDRKDLNKDAALEALKAFGVKNALPTGLLLELARAMFEALKLQEETGMERDTYTLLKLLADCDRPRLASSLINELIVERPGDSSWHRHLLTKGFLESLPSKDARDYFSHLTSRIQVQLAKPRTAEPPSKPAIKVTTVKMLAQLMADAEFVEPGFVVERLSELLVQAKHLDIRVAILESLVKILVNSSDHALRATILTVFEEHITPVASAVNERYPMSEEGWERARSSEDLPEVYMEENNPHYIAPVLQVLLDLCNSLKDDEKARLVIRVLLPILDLSASNNKRWIQVFAQKNNLVLPIGELPKVPVKPRFLNAVLFTCIEWMPASVFETYSDFVMMNLSPPQWLQDVNAKISDDVALRTSNGGKHWLSMWDLGSIRTLTQALGNQHYGISRLLHQSWNSAETGGVTHTQLQKHMCRLAGITMRKSDVEFSEWSAFLKSLAPQLKRSEEDQRHWFQHSRPIVEMIVQQLDSLRNDETWQRSASRQPEVLPDSFPLRLWLLTYPTMLWSADDVERRAIFVSEISRIIVQLATRTIPYHQRYGQLKAAAMSVYEVDYASIAVALDPLAKAAERTLSVADYLHAELADALLQAAWAPRDPEIVADVKLMLRGWKASQDEELRMRGYRAIRQIIKGTNSAQAWLRIAVE